MVGIIILLILLVICISLIVFLDKKMECNDIFFKKEELDEIKQYIIEIDSLERLKGIYAYLQRIVIDKKMKVWERNGIFSEKTLQITEDWEMLKNILFEKKKELENKI